MLESFLQTVVEELDLGEVPKKEESGFYSFKLNAQTSIAMQKRDPGFFFRSNIGLCPTNRREDLFILLMKANFLCQGTGKAVIGMDENEKFLTLSLVLPYDMNYKSFKEALEDFANYLDYWKAELVRHASEEHIF